MQENRLESDASSRAHHTSQILESVILGLSAKV
jgi:hypothetical protein